MDRAEVLRGAIANSVLEGWTPTPLDVARHTALAYRRGAARDPLIGAARTALTSR